MNANELADMAENACCAYQKEIAAMLRQQQAEIEHLKELFGCDPAYYERSAKTLTDEEINEIFSKTWLDLKDYKDFARAILRKAQEK
jgi:hypothetical protein